MTKEEILALAVKADLYLGSDESVIKFGKLVADEEREIIMAMLNGMFNFPGFTPEKILKIIRARGQ